MQRISDYATCPVATSSDPSVRNYFGNLDGDLDRIQKAYLETLLVQQKQQYELPLLTKSGGLNQGYHRNSSYGLSMPYPENSVAKSSLPSVGSGSFQSERAAHLAPMMRNSIGGSIGSWQSDIGSIAERRPSSSSIEGFKNNKTGSFELSDIAGQVVEFRYILNYCFGFCFIHVVLGVPSLTSLMQCSTDQYGSRFIQQKLETASVEEKNKIFPEIIPHARTLMTDVFGNYVIQKVHIVFI